MITTKVDCFSCQQFLMIVCAHPRLKILAFHFFRIDHRQSSIDCAKIKLQNVFDDSELVCCRQSSQSLVTIQTIVKLKLHPSFICCKRGMI